VRDLIGKSGGTLWLKIEEKLVKTLRKKEGKRWDIPG
jgi:hypothetical protein